MQIQREAINPEPPQIPIDACGLITAGGLPSVCRLYLSSEVSVKNFSHDDGGAAAG